MANIITGLIAVSLIVVFLGYYAIDLASIALGIITAAVLVMVIVDLIQSFRESNNQNGGQGS